MLWMIIQKSGVVQLKICIAKNSDEMSLRAATLIADEMKKNPNLVAAIPTGSTPIGTLAELVRMHREEDLDFSQFISFNIDEYCSLSPEDPNSYYYFLKEKLYRHVNIPFTNTYVPKVAAVDKECACKAYDEQISKLGGLDFILLGIGNDGHIGFNEPDNLLHADTHVAQLHDETIQANSRFFPSLEETPRQAITMGISIIMQAKKVVLIANGKNKAEVVNQLLTRRVVSMQFPASVLLLHRDVTVIVDEEAAEIYTKTRSIIKGEC